MGHKTWIKEIDDQALMPRVTWERSHSALQGSLAALFIADANGFIHARQKYLSISDLARARRSKNGLNGLLNHRIRQNHFQLGLGNKIHAVLPAPAYLGVALL